MTAASGESEKEVMVVDHDSFKSQDQMNKTRNTISFLTLGDGDFTYSLDLARYLASTKTDANYVVTATGVDTREELLSKYKDSPFVLKELANAALASPDSGSETNDKMIVHIRHGINAIVMPTTLVTEMKGSSHNVDHENNNTSTFKCPTSPKSPVAQSPSSHEALDSPAIQPADHVMFHHPHLATEDAVLHQKFLCHLFHTVNHVWLKPFTNKSDNTSNGNESEHDSPGFFHLTLVKGQAERWKCLDAARDQGFELVWRGPFVPPPPPTSNNEEVTPTTYQLRRHQTGKSFASRRPEWQSESLIFQRTGERTSVGSIQAASILPWDIYDQESAITKPLQAAENTAHHDASLLPCPHCDKVFREERSLKCHLNAKHAALVPPQDNTDKKHRKKRKRETSTMESVSNNNNDDATNSWHCPHECRGIDGELRTFVSQEALQSHIVAKHSGLHQSISPDWKQLDTTKVARNKETREILYYYGHCNICGWRFETKAAALEHIHDFTPPSTVLSYFCRFCGKIFREKRAQLQHENFCSHKRS